LLLLLLLLLFIFIAKPDAFFFFQLFTKLEAILSKFDFQLQYDYRRLFEAQIDDKIRSYVSKVTFSEGNRIEPINLLSKNVTEKRDVKLFSATVENCTDAVFRSANLPAGVASTEAIRTIFYTMIICVSAKVPLQVLGPPGCSKTLALVLLEERMKVHYP